MGTVYLVADRLDRRLGDVWREADCETTDLETVIQGKVDGVPVVDCRYGTSKQYPEHWHCVDHQWWQSRGAGGRRCQHYSVDHFRDDQRRRFEHDAQC